MSGTDPERVANLLAVTDSDLAHLDVDAMLVELLDRIRASVDADTAAVLLRDGDSPYLVARAARGLEEEVHQGVRVPIGVGFAGAIAERREPVSLIRVDQTTVANPILWEKGIKVMLGVPLISRDQVIGVLHVGRLSDNPFTGAEVELLQVAGQRVSAATSARHEAIDVVAGRLLERSLQPTRLPELAGLEFAARYVPAELSAVGGDWYDAFALPDGQLWIVIGDVAGHGLNAAVIMGRVKSALRAYALLGVSPEEVLELTDRKVIQFEIGTMVTVVCASSQPPYDTIRVCLAGHPPPVFAAPDRPTTLVHPVVGPPLGVQPGVRRAAIDLAWPAGAVLLFYTDGLIERRGVDLDERLDQLVCAVSPAEPEKVCIAVMHEMIGNRAGTDDIAFLAVRRTSDTAADRAGKPHREGLARSTSEQLAGVSWLRN
jgi:sigma-B regulation protein RsbU (phosphoserine phosphatase)